MFLVGPKVSSFVVKGVKSHKFRYSKGVGFTIESYGKVEISPIFKMDAKTQGKNSDVWETFGNSILLLSYETNWK